MRVAVLLCLCLAATGCGSVATATGDRLSFAQVQSLNPGVDGEWILSEFPFARERARWPNGRLRSLGYWVNDPAGRPRPLMLHFDAQGVLVRKEYGGPLLRPPEPGGGLEIGVGR